MAALYPRHLRAPLLETPADTRVVFVAGARQVGKTTLTREIAGGEHPMTMLSHPREQTIPLGERLWALPIAALWA